MKRLLCAAALLASFLVASCGGGEGAPAALALAQPAASPAAGPLRSGPLRAQPEFTFVTFLDWAEATYPQFFHGTRTSGTYAAYDYRYYAATGHYLAVTSDNSVYALGPATGGEVLPIGTLSKLICLVYPLNCAAAPVDGVPADISAGPGATSEISSINMHSVSSHVLVVKKDGSVWGWGSNERGQLGPQTTVYTVQDSPVRLSVLSTYFTAVHVGPRRSFASGPGTYTWAWGDNYMGTLGDGTTVNRTTPVNVANATGAVASATLFSAMVSDDGSLWGWGAGLYANGYTPRRIGEGFASVSAGVDHMVALKRDGSVWTWGYEELGVGRPNRDINGNPTITTPASMLTGAVKVWAGPRTGYALKADGSLWAWGLNSRGQLGDGTITDRLLPVQIATGFVSLAPGADHVAALKADGSLWTWGGNDYGQLANGTKTAADGTLSDSLVPRKVALGVTQIAAGEFATLAANAAGQVYGAGWNHLATLGDGTRNDATVLTKSLFAAGMVGNGGGGGGGTETGLAGTWCTDVNGNQNCWVFDNSTGSATGKFYQQSINQYSGTLTNTMTWSVNAGAQSLTYRFTWSELTNSAYDYSQAVNQQTYTFPFTLSSSVFRFQGIDFYRR